jgi:hypothetical protein
MQHCRAWWIEDHIAAALWFGLALLLAPYVHADEGTATEPSDFYGHFALGTGASVQYDGTSTTPLGLATWTWDEDHYELAAFRFLTAQTRMGQDFLTVAYVF